MIKMKIIVIIIISFSIISIGCETKRNKEIRLKNEKVKLENEALQLVKSSKIGEVAEVAEKQGKGFTSTSVDFGYEVRWDVEQMVGELYLYKVRYIYRPFTDDWFYEWIVNLNNKEIIPISNPAKTIQEGLKVGEILERIKNKEKR